MLALPEYTITNAMANQFLAPSLSHRVVEGEFKVDGWCALVKGECSKGVDVVGRRAVIKYDEGAWLRPGSYQTVKAELASIAEEHPDMAVIESVKRLYK